MDRILDAKVIKGKRWEFHLRPTRSRNFIVAKQKSMYDTTIEVKVHTMWDGTQIATPDNPRDLVEGDVLATLKKSMLALQEVYC